VFEAALSRAGGAAWGAMDHEVKFWRDKARAHQKGESSAKKRRDELTLQVTELKEEVKRLKEEVQRLKNPRKARPAAYKTDKSESDPAYRKKVLIKATTAAYSSLRTTLDSFNIEIIEGTTQHRRDSLGTRVTVDFAFNTPAAAPGGEAGGQDFSVEQEEAADVSDKLAQLELGQMIDVFLASFAMSDRYVDWQLVAHIVC
jgi:uncharacterized small protein (DUF1192 family)